MAPADRRGYWGHTTSTIDWCEENYVVSFYVAEFWNTVSNLIMIIPPIFGALQMFRDGLELRYICSFLGLAVVGVGSWCFHMTLKYEMQLMDELPMIYSTCVFVYCLYECFKQENKIGLVSIALLLFFSVSVSAVYLQWKEPIFHQVMYGTLVACLVIRSIYIVTWVYPWLRPLCYTSLGIFLLGFLFVEHGQFLLCYIKENQTQPPSCCWSSYTVSCLVAYFHRPWVLPAHTSQPADQDNLPQVQTKSEVSLWSLAHFAHRTTEDELKLRDQLQDGDCDVQALSVQGPSTPPAGNSAHSQEAGGLQGNPLGPL